MKSPAMYPPIKDPIPNQDINRLTTKKDPSLSPNFAKYLPVHESLLNDSHDPNSTEYDRNDCTDNPRNKNEDTINNTKVNNNEDNDGEYKDDNFQALNSNESVINKTEEEEALIEILASMNYPTKVVNYVLGTISSCGKKMIKFER